MSHVLYQITINLNFGMSGSLKILFCINEGAGTKRKVDWQGLITDHLKGSHFPIMLQLGEGPKEQIEEAIRKNSPDIVVAVGGDGTVNMVATILGGSGMPMGIIPAGSANGLATELKIPADHFEAIDLIVAQKPRSLDAILINDTDLCIHLSDLGLNARLIKYFDESPSRGMFTYARLSWKVLFRKDRFKVSVRAEKETYL
ncbi:MAG: diacylglycerol kinase family lipid kinase, partial [Bacteroidota bacterium]|nr:diacylglycerol kinase family lipid kinase [Bacteroidota bacterium]